eukprot:3846518-Amphidinium_carterae.2
MQLRLGLSQSKAMIRSGTHYQPLRVLGDLSFSHGPCGPAYMRANHSPIGHQHRTGMSNSHSYQLNQVQPKLHYSIGACSLEPLHQLPSCIMEPHRRQ